MRLLFWSFLPKQHKRLTGNTFTTQSSSRLLAKGEATQLARFIARSGFVKLQDVFQVLSAIGPHLPILAGYKLLC